MNKFKKTAKHYLIIDLRLVSSIVALKENFKDNIAAEGISHQLFFSIQAKASLSVLLHDLQLPE